MGIIDWIILGLLLLFTYLGWRKGFATAVIQFCGYILTFFLVGHYYPLVQRSLLLKYNMARALATIISILLIIVLIFVVSKLIIYIISRLLVATKLSTLNKGVGAILGFGNGLLVLIILMVMLDFIPNVSTPLKDGEKHRVYAGVDVLKEEVFAKLKLTERMKLIKMPKLPMRSTIPPGLSGNK
ncbi:MAG: hypothetical protein CVU50_10210 [Candidatus Cloacimonetes bacterium HGW-Cloacimonetes-3]|jgi:uncharacterized membrane protein required for colicin V production|nr:MAG: hypothetical protein CVU50_10210 [Candidatus Cloacimonetes bacterium HGW-Cloacimonetes-3]